MRPDQFYDDLALYFHLIFEDWEASMARQGDALARFIQQELGTVQPQALHVLDASCGIGTQTLPLAARGFQMVARDLSPAAVARLQREAAARQLTVDAASADMRRVGETVSGPFDVVLSCDNSVPHLLTDADILAAFRELAGVLRPGGLFLCSVRDYDQVQRGVPSSQAYGDRQQDGETFFLRQEWTWDDPMHYQMTFIVEREAPEGRRQVLRTVTRYYAVSIGRLLELMEEAGFLDCRRSDDVLYQPILIGRKAAAFQRRDGWIP